jgi:hypothetical protein
VVVACGARCARKQISTIGGVSGCKSRSRSRGERLGHRALCGARHTLRPGGLLFAGVECRRQRSCALAPRSDRAGRSDQGELLANPHAATVPPPREKRRPPQPTPPPPTHTPPPPKPPHPPVGVADVKTTPGGPPLARAAPAPGCRPTRRWKKAGTAGRGRVTRSRRWRPRGGRAGGGARNARIATRRHGHHRGGARAWWGRAGNGLDRRTGVTAGRRGGCPTRWVVAIEQSVTGRGGAVIEATVAAWDRRVDVGGSRRRSGGDLQFIRINGTLVGGLWLLLYARGAAGGRRALRGRGPAGRWARVRR